MNKLQSDSTIVADYVVLWYQKLQTSRKIFFLIDRPYASPQKLSLSGLNISCFLEYIIYDDAQSAAKLIRRVLVLFFA